MLARAEKARFLNRVNGCTVFHAWNVDALPGVDISEMILTENWRKDLHG
jgi:hypothetical protein